MTNNLVGQVLASTVLVSYPLVIVPILTHTLVQQLVAGAADLILRRTAPTSAAATARGEPALPCPAC
jgi:hypothetical protein